MPLYGEKFIYVKTNLSEQQLHVAVTRAAAAKRERELACKWAGQGKKGIQRLEVDRLPQELLGSGEALGERDSLPEEVDTCSITSDLVQPKEGSVHVAVRQHDAPPAEGNLSHVEEGESLPGTLCTTTLFGDNHVTVVVTLQRWVLVPSAVFLSPARGGVLVPRQHGNHVVWRRRGVEQYLERSISWLRFFCFAKRRRDLVVGSEVQTRATLLEARRHHVQRWLPALTTTTTQDLVLHSLLPRTVVVTLQE